MAENTTKGRRSEGGGADSGRRETAVDESRKEMADRVARHQADSEVGHDYSTNGATNWFSWSERGLPMHRLLLVSFHSCADRLLFSSFTYFSLLFLD